ncbi:MAG: hypothetical protein QXD77_01475 [Candidatus Aenigmatarchaeota archaeon]
MAKRKAAVKKAKAFSSNLLILVIIASVLLSVGIFYATGMLIGDLGGGLPGGSLPDMGGGTVIITGSCMGGNCTACTNEGNCTAIVGCEWTTELTPTGGAIMGGFQQGTGGACYSNVDKAASVRAGVAGGSTEPINVSVNDAGISSITVQPTASGDIGINVKSFINKPGKLTAPASGIPYKYYWVSGNSTAVSNVKINFDLPSTWASGTANLKVWRATGSTFSPVTTTHAASGSNIIVTGEANGFSYWTVTGETGCSGAVSLSLPSTATGGETVTAKVSGLSNCAGKTGYIKADSCAGATACTFSTSATGGSCNLDVPDETNILTYYACVDMNGNGLFTDAGESDFSNVDVTESGLELGENVTGGETGAECGNDNIETGEECDTTQLGGTTCQDLGYVSGTLKCSADCTFDTGACISEKPATAEDALNAINAATTAVSTARKEGKNVTEAASLLNEAITAYDGGKFDLAKSKADAAKAAAEAAEAAEKPAELPIGAIIGAVAVLAVGGGLFYANKKGMLKNLKLPGKKKVRMPEESEITR